MKFGLRRGSVPVVATMLAMVGAMAQPALAAATFVSAPDVGVGSTPFSVAVGDFNGDGKADLAVANDSSDTVSVRLGDGAGGFTAAPDVGVGRQPYSVAVGDFNGDAKADLAVSNFSS